MKKSKSTALVVRRPDIVAGKKNPIVQKVSLNIIHALREMNNAVMSRAAYARTFLENLGGHDIDTECGYPKNITLEMYRKMFGRNGVAQRVVTFFAKESWTVEPMVYIRENLDLDEELPWEKEWKKIWKKCQLYKHLAMFDEVSGIGHYGGLLLGFSDNKDLSKRVTGISEHDEATGKAKKLKLLYVTPLDEANLRIKSFVKDKSSPRYGLPQMYSMRKNDPDASTEQAATDAKWEDVHWSRIHHLPSDGGPSTSRVFGPPRQKVVFNRLIDIDKVAGSSAEMFWKGGFPGIAFEVPGEVLASGSEIQMTADDKKALKEEIEKYMNSMKRYLSLVGVTAKQLQSNIADPDTHLDVQIMLICVAIEAPRRLFMGTEEGKLSSEQDVDQTNKRVQRRQYLRCSNDILYPLAERLEKVGVLPERDEEDELKSYWPDVYSVSGAAKAEIAQNLVRAIAEYLESGAKEFFPPLEFLTMILELNQDQAQAVLDAAEKYIKKEVKMGRMLDPKEKVKLEREEKKAGIKSMLQPPASPSAQGPKGGSQGRKGGNNRPKRSGSKSK